MKRYTEALDKIVRDLKKGTIKDPESSIDEVTLIREAFQEMKTLPLVEEILIGQSKVYPRNPKIHYAKSLIVNMCDKLGDE